MEDDDDLNLEIDNEEILNDNNEKNESICDSYYFIFAFYLVESLISFGAFYLFYRFQIGDKNNKIYKIIILSLSGVLLIFYTYFAITFHLHTTNEKKFNDCVLFFLISIFKICFFSFVYLMTVLTGDNRISYSHFEARAYWKISICLLYLALIFYEYFKKDKYSENICIVIIICIISLLIYLFLTLFTQRKGDNWDRLWIYIIYCYLEIQFTIETIFLYKEEYNKERNNKNFEKLINWKINEIDMTRYALPFFILIKEGFYCCYNNLRICKKIKNNFSLSSD